MQSVTDLQNVIIELQDIVDNTLASVFSDLTNNSSAFTPIIDGYNDILIQIDNMINLLNSDVIQGLQGEQGIQGIQGGKGDQGIQGIQGVKGDQGIQGIQGIQGEQGLSDPSAIYKKLASLKETNTTAGITLTDLEYVYEAGTYEFEIFGTHRTVSSTTGVTFQLSVKSGDVLFADGQFSPSNARTSADVYNAFMSSNIITFSTIAMTAINVACPFVIRGKLIALSSGTLTSKFATEVANFMATLPECHMFIKKIA